MKKILTISAAVVFLAQAKAWAKDPYVDINTTMCTEGEDIYISCAFNPSSDQYSYVGKVASICAKSNTSPDTGYVQYRYGKPSYGDGPASIEMQYPEQKIPPKGIFTIYTSVNPKTIGSALRFSNGKHLYSFERLTYFQFKVVARKQGEKLFNKDCDLPGIGYLTTDAHRGIQTIDLNETMISDSDK